MSTTTGATTALDLDAIEARANASTPQPWARKGHDVGQVVYCSETPPELVGPVMLGRGIGEAAYADAEFIAHARTDIPVLVAEVRRLRPRVISGDVEAVTAALDGLPVGSIITCDDDGLTKGGAVYHKRQFSQSDPQWYESGFATRVYARGIARHQVPITVLREGTGA